MIFGKTKLELKVGIFVFFGLTILITFILLIGNIKTWTSGYKVDFIFEFVNGVKVGAPVRFAGVDVGVVKKIKLMPLSEENKIKIQVACWVRKEVNISVDSTVWVNTLGLLGEKYVEIIPGKEHIYMVSGDSLRGVDPIPMHEVTRLAKSIVDNVNETLIKIRNPDGTIGKLLYDDTIYKELEALVVDIRKNPWKIFWKTKEKK